MPGLSPFGAHAICLGLCAADYVARAWRIQLLARGVHHSLTFRDAMAVNAIGDAACSVSPLRIAGEPARLGVLLSAGLPPTASLVAITYEVLTAWPIILLCAAGLVWGFAPAWWEGAAPGLGASLREAWPWVVVVAAVTLVVWLWVRHALPAASHHLRRPLRRVLVHWRQMPWPLLLATAPLTMVNLVSRVAILPVLAATLPHPPPVGSLLVGSLALLYSQLILPTPSGAGAVDLGFLGGAAGNLGSREGSLLFVWRFYTTGVGLIIGMLLAMARFGWRPIRSWFRLSVAQPSE